MLRIPCERMWTKKYIFFLKKIGFTVIYRVVIKGTLQFNIHIKVTES